MNRLQLELSDRSWRTENQLNEREVARGAGLGWGCPYPTLFPPSFRFLFSPSCNKEPVHRLASEKPSDSYPFLFFFYLITPAQYGWKHILHRRTDQTTAPTMVNLQTASSTENNAFVCYFQVRKHTLQLTIELDYSLNIPKSLHLFFCLRSSLFNYKGLHLQSPLEKNSSLAFCKLIFS